jgi:GNAT superfamily N-acetyltransferase
LSTIETWPPERARQEAAEVFAVYHAVFRDAPDEADWRSSTYDRHVARDGFRLTAALDGDRLVGFAYGYVGARGQYWPDRVAEALGEAVTADWLGGHFEFVELAVLPSHRGRGLGAALHDALLLDAPGDRAMLSTADDPADPAVRLYASRGWRKLGNLTPDVQVMGLAMRKDRRDIV